MKPIHKMKLPVTTVVFTTLINLLISTQRAEAWNGSYVGTYTSINFDRDRQMIDVNMLDVHPPGPDVAPMYEIALLMRPGESYKATNTPSSSSVQCNLGMQQMGKWVNGFTQYILVALTQNVGVNDGSNCTYVIQSSLGRSVAVRYRKERM